jgi:hypothetical protein
MGFFLSEERGWIVSPLPVAVFLLMSVSLSAQDFETRWIDRIRQELREEPPLTAKPLLSEIVAGEIFFYDSNISLTEDADPDTIFVTFARGRVDYTEELFDLVGDLMINYNLYLDESDASDHEERFYGRLRYAGPSVELEVWEVFRRESDPVDAVFADRTVRVISDTHPRVSYEIMPELTLETAANIQYVRYDDDAFASRNNVNYRLELSPTFHLNARHDFFLQAGYHSFKYSDSSGPEDANGLFFRAGYRGELLASMQVEALLGYSTAKSNEFEITGNVQDADVVDVQLHMRYEATDSFLLLLSYARGLSFSGENSSFQVVDQFILNAKYAALPELELGARMQYELADPAEGESTDYTSFSVGADYTFLDDIVADAGVTYRFGSVADSNFEGFIVYLGVLGRF